MSHDLYASWATSELANRFTENPSECFVEPNELGEFSMFANRENGRIWPIPDGRISIENQDRNRFEIAIEMKRENEGLHGILTAIGQSQAYLHKGYSGSAIIIPNEYNTHDSPGQYINDVMTMVNPEISVGVFSYQIPDSASPTPFRGRITCHRPVFIQSNRNVQTGNFLLRQKTKTQWAHLREGSSEPDAFFKYLQIAKSNSFNSIGEFPVNFPQELIDACSRLDSSKPIEKYLSNSIGDEFHDLVWRNFWFKYVLHDLNAQLYRMENGNYVENHVLSGLLLFDNSGGYKKFFSGKANSPKRKIVNKLNSGQITEDDAWEEFATNVRSRAHSYREDIDSGLDHLGLIESDGKPSQIGYKFVDACERNGNSQTGIPKLILGNSLLDKGNMIAFLHYFHRLSEEKFQSSQTAYSLHVNGRFKFDKDRYLTYIHNELANNLKVMNTATLRGGAARKPFQAELAILRKFGFVGSFRIGLGLEINWPLISEYLDFDY